jgi:DUF4097 and DUF4098 domain-containing protein YvlB
MKKSLLILLILCLTGILTLQAESYRFEEKEEIRKTLKFQNPSGDKELQLDNIWGSITVEGADIREVQLVAHKTIKGRTKEKIQKAKEEVSLDISEDGNTIDLYVEGPFRYRERNRRNRSLGYIVQYNFELKVPYKTSLYLKTVIDGDVRVKNFEGDFEVRNVNGKIKISDVAGSGKAHTVNGNVQVFFSQNPKSDCSFHTINGDIDLTFPKDPSADFLLKTFNGDAYTDFSVKYLPSKAEKSTKRNGKYIYKSSRFTTVRTGKGGPEIKIDTFNGDILLAKRK